MSNILAYTQKLAISSVLTLSIVTVAFASGLLTALSNQDATDGLRQALSQGAEVAIAQLGKNNGFYGNPKVRIPLPGSIEKGASMLRRVGMGPQLDQLEVTMNKAAEAAVVEAKPVLVNAIKQMSVNDAKQILTGGNTSATEYFRRTTSTDLTTRFLPIVKKHTDQLGVAQQYSQLAKPAANFGLIDSKQASIDGYVTQKALDGLFLMVAEEEKAIRQNPVKQSSAILQKVFGAVGK
ncbi:MAG: DUF4197 domain-containing protein [Pseudomonadales bacterium]